MRHFNEEQVNAGLSMPVAVEAIEQAFQNLALGRAENIPRQRCKATGIVLHSMSAAADYLGLVGFKQYSTTRNGARFHVGLYDLDGVLVALIEADRLGQMRTGATTGVAVKYLAPQELHEFGMIGAGWQAESQLEAIVAVRPIQRAVVYARNETRCRDFAQRMSERHGIDVVAETHAKNAVAGMRVVVTATNSKQPVLSADWLAADALICAMGSNWLEKSELDRETVDSAELIVCDSVECCQQEAGDFSAAIEARTFHWSDVKELTDVVTNQLEIPRGRVIFKSVGMALEDIALAAKLISDDAHSTT